MVNIGSYMWFVSASIGLLSLTHFNVATKKRIHDVTVRSLKFLATYQANVTGHHSGPVDEHLKETLLEEWKGSFFTPEETSTKLYNLVEKDWQYALALASSNENNFSALVVALHTKMEAYLQSLYYMPCFTILVNRERYNSEHCQNLAVYLLIFSYIGTDQLIEKFSTVGAFLSAHNSLEIKVLQTLLPQFYHDLKYNLREKCDRAPDEDKMADDLLDDYLHLLANNDLLVALYHLSSKMMFGPFPATVWQDEYIPYWYDASYLKFMWMNAEDINKRLTKVLEGNDNYDVTNALHDIIIQRAEFREISRLDLVNDLDEIKLKNMEIRIIDGEFSVNLH